MSWVSCLREFHRMSTTSQLSHIREELTLKSSPALLTIFARYSFNNCEYEFLERLNSCIVIFLNDSWLFITAVVFDTNWPTSFKFIAPKMGQSGKEAFTTHAIFGHGSLNRSSNIVSKLTLSATSRLNLAAKSFTVKVDAATASAIFLHDISLSSPSNDSIKSWGRLLRKLLSDRLQNPRVSKIV